MTTRYTNLTDNKGKTFGGAYSVHDSETCWTRDEAVKNYIDNQSQLDNEEIKSKYLQTYKQWMFSVHPEITGWEDYNELCFTQGTTESFAQFYLRFRDHRRLRLAKGEYFYNQMMKGLWYNEKFAWLDEDQIRPNDVVLFSFRCACVLWARPVGHSLTLPSSSFRQVLSSSLPHSVIRPEHLVLRPVGGSCWPSFDCMHIRVGLLLIS